MSIFRGNSCRGAATPTKYSIQISEKKSGTLLARLGSRTRGRGPEGLRMAALHSDSEEDLVSYGTGLEPLEEGVGPVGRQGL